MKSVNNTRASAGYSNSLVIPRRTHCRTMPPKADPFVKPHSLSRPSSTAAVWGCALFAASALYATTANRGAQWQDSGVQQLRIVSGHIDNPGGLALIHPVQFWLGRVAIRTPGIVPAFAITLISSLAGAIAVANLAATISLLTRNNLVTVVCTTALALSHTFWQHATHTESYTIFAMFLTGEWLCLAAFARFDNVRFLLLAALLSGLGLATHMMAVLAVPANVAVLLWAIRTRKCSWRAVAGAVLLWLAGTTPYSGLVVLRIIQTGDAAHVIHSAIFGEYAYAVLNTHVSVRGIMLPFGYVAYNLPGLTVPLAIVGIYTAIKKRSAPTWFVRVLLADLLIFAVFVFRFSIVDQYTFFFPVYLLLAIFAGIGLTHVMAPRSRRFSQSVVALAAITAVWTPIVYPITASILRSRGVLKSMVGNKPYRDGYRSFFVPWGVGDNHADRVNEEVRALAGEDGLVFLPYIMIGVGVRYEQAVGGYPDSITLRNTPNVESDAAAAEWRADLKAALKAGKPVVLVPKDRDAPEDFIPGLTWKRRGDLYVLEAIGPPTTIQPGDVD